MTVNLSELIEIPLSAEGLIKLVEMCGLPYLKEEVDGETRLKLFRVDLKENLIPV